MFAAVMALVGLGVREIAVLLVLGGFCLAMVVGGVVLVVFLTRDKKGPTPEDED